MLPFSVSFSLLPKCATGTAQLKYPLQNTKLESSSLSSLFSIHPHLSTEEGLYILSVSERVVCESILVSLFYCEHVFVTSILNG